MLYVTRPTQKAMFAALLMAFSFNASAFQKEIPFTIGDPYWTAREALKSDSSCPAPDLGFTRTEIVEKNSLIEMKLKNPKQFEQVRQNRLENSPLYQSWIDEVNEALSERPLPRKLTLRKNESLLQKFYEGTKIDLAKKVAKKELFLSLKKSWPWLKDTIFNEFDVTAWCRTRPQRPSAEAPVSIESPTAAEFSITKINEMLLFSPKNSSGKNFEFDFDFGGRNFVEIDRNTLRHGRVGLDINSDHDVNRLEPGADKIQADNSGQAPDTSSGAAGSPQDDALAPPAQ